ncbi:hypothetical protein B5M42_021610 [Paenibacillus athensensis]|uniref:Uncharacterized protein n=1 Tax=Paenibacillus athensensis TaxID=1967502 RepID=A0A4Y8PZU4_9BACL|nr:hypothetical protein [Paenibacillus athensensis]MCD1261402.1 hypothetical protein [Paenibacillus athensensis]
MNQKFLERSIEVHDTATMWNPEKIQKIVDFMVRHDMNNLIFHENDIVDKLVFPSLLYKENIEDRNIYSIFENIYQTIYDKTPSPFVFIDEKAILVELMRSIARIASRAGIRFFLQSKELWFADLLFRDKKLMKDGVMCPSDPFWWETYLPAKYEELFIAIPELSGIVTSTGTRESRASLAHGICKCDRCRNFDLQEWQKNIIMSIYKPIKETGKQLVVRDFTYYADEQSGLRAGVLSLPDDIVVSIKNTPQDFYPTFPDNALIGNVGNHEQWIEYEVMGEYFGFGAVPSIMIEDIRARMKYALSKGAKGFTARVDWEALPNHSAFDTVNILNVYATAMLAKNPDLPGAEIYRAYLTEHNLFADGLTKEQQDACIAKVMEILEPTWPIMAKTPYINDFLFSSNSKIPANIEHGEFLAKEHHGLQKWFPERAKDHDMTPENVALFLNEKEQALDEVNAVYKLIIAGNPGLKEDYYKLLTAQIEMYRLYVEQFRAVANVYILVKAAAPKSDGSAIAQAMEELRRMEDRIKNYRFPAYEYPASVLICYEKVRYFRLNAQKVIAEMKLK